MISTDDIRKLQVYVPNSKGELKKFGRVRATLFHPHELRAVGYIIKRPDALLMVKRQDHFVALDRVEAAKQGLAVIDSPDAWDKKACARLGVDYEMCVIWEGMPIRTGSGKEHGAVRSIVFDEANGQIDHIEISANAADKLILGSANIAAMHIKGYADGAIIIDDGESDPIETGGVAAKAGEAWAKTKHEASKGAGKAADKAADAINTGAYHAGEAIGTVRDKAKTIAKEHETKKKEAEARGEYTGVDKAANLFGQQLGKASGMFKSFKEEFDKASHDDRS